MLCACGADVERLYEHTNSGRRPYVCRECQLAKARKRERLRRSLKPREPSVWEANPDLLDRAIELGKTGISFEAIAAALGLGLTRNSLISKFDRSGLSKPRPDRNAKKTTVPAGWRAPRKEKSEKRSLPPDPSILALLNVLFDPVHPPVPEGERRDVQSVADTQCRWPIGDPLLPGFHFCAMEAEPGVSYCAGHAGRAYDVVPRQRRAFDLVEAVTDKIIETVD